MNMKELLLIVGMATLIIYLEYMHYIKWRELRHAVVDNPKKFPGLRWFFYRKENTKYLILSYILFLIFFLTMLILLYYRKELGLEKFFLKRS